MQKSPPNIRTNEKYILYIIILKWTNAEPLANVWYYNGFVHAGSVNAVFLVVVDKNNPAWVNFQQ